MNNRLRFGFFLVIASLTVALAHPQGGRPIPPGVREADAQTGITEQPPPIKKRSLDPAQLKREADELAKLSASIPDQVALVAKGQLPKDLSDQLKHIEKLSKRIRSEISE